MKLSNLILSLSLLASVAQAADPVEVDTLGEVQVKSIVPIHVSTVKITGAAAEALYKTMEKVKPAANGSKRGENLFCANTTQGYFCSFFVMPDGKVISDSSFFPNPAGTGTN